MPELSETQAALLSYAGKILIILPLSVKIVFGEK
jgi:hypothetical protein